MGRIITAFLLSLVLSGCATVKATYEVTDILEQRTWEEVWKVEGDTLSAHLKDSGMHLSTTTWENHVIRIRPADDRYQVLQSTILPIDWLSAGQKTFGHIVIRNTQHDYSVTGVISVKAEQKAAGLMTLTMRSTIPLPGFLLHEEVVTTHSGEITFLPERREERYIRGGELHKYLVYIKKR